METITIWQPLQILKLPTACSATSAHFYLCHRYETPVLNVNVSLDMANLQLINITALHFCIWQHLGNDQSDIQLQHLATIPSIQVHKIYQHLLNSTMQLTPFNTEPSEDKDSLWRCVHPPRNICFSFRITHTSRNQIILLLFLLVSTCQISMPTFSIR